MISLQEKIHMCSRKQKKEEEEEKEEEAIFEICVSESRYSLRLSSSSSSSQP